MKHIALFGSLTCLFAFQGICTAGDFTWTFQRTGFRSTSSTPQTAVSMRGNLSWPVVYGLDLGALNAYSLFAVPNPGPVPISPATNWHQIGSNLTRSFLPSSNLYLQAASGSPDGFGVSLQTPTIVSQPPDAVVVGNSFTGFQPPVNGAQALKFDDQGQPFTANSAMLPGIQTNQKLFDAALSKFGEVGAVTQASGGNGTVTFWQQSPLLGGAWLSGPINPEGRGLPTLFGPTIDLTYDAASRPYVVGIDRLTSNNSVAAFQFDVISGAWISSILDTTTLGGPPIADVAAAANDHGIVGAAWVNFGTLRYAYLDTNEQSPHWIVSTVATTTPTNVQLELSQGVGLAYDKSGLPVISFVDRGSRQIWIAYDPALTAAPPATGDFNGDGVVDARDLSAWNASFAEGSADGADFLAWQRNAGAAPTPGETAAVPEPAAIFSALIAAVTLAGVSRTHSSKNQLNLTFTQ
jgi:hypothetical protein